MLKEKMQEVNFEVLETKLANKPGYIAARVRFLGNPKIYTYIRKLQNPEFDTFGELTHEEFIIDGCKVTRINNSYDQVFSIERLYNTAGVKRKDTSSIGKTLSEKIKEEIVKDEEVEIKETKDKDEAKDKVEEINWDELEVKHEMYETIKTCLVNEIPVFLSGPAGSGKNYTVEKIAEELGWDFYFSNAVQQEFKLTGFIDAGGDYHPTEFYKACTSENKAIFFLDEMDASIPEVLVLLNAAIANGYFEFPTGRVNLDNVHFVAAGNTVGSGADENYTGRFVLDQATLDRFAIIEFAYSKMIEMKLAKGNEDLVEYVRQLRTHAENTGIRATFSYRCISMVTKLEEAKMPLKDILKIAVFKGLDKDTVSMFQYQSVGKYNYQALS